MNQVSWLFFVNFTDFYLIFEKNRDADQEVMDEEVTELQTMLGDAINKIVKFHHKSLNEKLR